ncbi:MAG: hypothetical protein QNL91_02715 [Candidatus Krumholzibacteria bacterium]|nr:hypothetical protein [Candidatus Krumholzibacteria bacterium]
MFSARYVDTDVERARWRFTLNYKLVRNLQVGVEFNATIAEFTPLATLFVLTETAGRPAFFLGTSSDRIGSPEGTQAYYATTSKHLPGLGTTGYFSVNYSEWDDRINVPFGAAQELGRDFAVRYMYDGEKSHALLDHYRDSVGVSLMWVWLEQFGVALHGGF